MNSPELTTLQRALSHLYIEVPERIARDVETAFNAFLKSLDTRPTPTPNPPADLWVGCYCARCGVFVKWHNTNTAQHGRRHDDYHIIRQLCEPCCETVNNQSTR